MVPAAHIAPGYTIPRIIKGGWQLAGGHGAVDHDRALADMMRFAEAGITAFDCADIYTGVEALIGEFLRMWRATHGPSAPPIRIHTKCVPDRDALSTLRCENCSTAPDCCRKPAAWAAMPAARKAMSQLVTVKRWRGGMRRRPK